MNNADIVAAVGVSAPTRFLEVAQCFVVIVVDIEAYDEYSTDEPPPFLSHHPPNPERITAIRRELKLVTIPAAASSDSTKFKVLKSALALLVAPGRNP
jgi:hypothetical protein